MIKKNKAKIDRLEKEYYCKHCEEFVVPKDGSKHCFLCNTKLRVVYKERKHG